MDDLGEKEYLLRTEGMSANDAAAIAVEISGDRKKEEDKPATIEEQPIEG